MTLLLFCGNETLTSDMRSSFSADKPEIVTMVTNTTENEDCSDLWVNFTCISSEANPPVYNYLLSDDKDGFSFSESGTWIKKISRGGKSIYSCIAYQPVENVSSEKNITLTVNGELMRYRIRLGKFYQQDYSHKENSEV